jgi:hypothetical protein
MFLCVTFQVRCKLKSFFSILHDKVTHKKMVEMEKTFHLGQKSRNLTFSNKKGETSPGRLPFLSHEEPRGREVFLFSHLKCMTEVEKRIFSLHPFIFNKRLLLTYRQTRSNKDTNKKKWREIQRKMLAQNNFDAFLHFMIIRNSSSFVRRCEKSFHVLVCHSGFALFLSFFWLFIREDKKKGIKGKGHPDAQTCQKKR